MAKYRLRTSDAVFEATIGDYVADVVASDRQFSLSRSLFNRLFEPVPDEPTVDAEVEKLAKVMHGSAFPGESWASESVFRPHYTGMARAILDAGYTPPPEPKVIRVGSRVRYCRGKTTGEVRFIEVGFATVKWDCDGSYGSYPLANLTLIEEGTARG